jgi:hypothetical protein
MQEQEKSEERSVSSDKKPSLDNSWGSRTTRSFFAWFSIPRLVGLLLGNSRDLESQIDDKNKEIEYLKSQIDRWQNQCIAFQDTTLLGKGMRATVSSSNNQSTTQTKQIKTNVPSENLAIAAELDRLIDVLIHRPKDIEDTIKDLEAQPNPRNKIILEKFYTYVEAMPDTEQGVIVMQ